MTTKDRKGNLDKSKFKTERYCLACGKKSKEHSEEQIFICKFIIKIYLAEQDLLNQKSKK